MSEGPLVSIVPQTGNIPIVQGGPGLTGGAQGLVAITSGALDTLIKGEVAGRDKQGNTLLNTDRGQIAIKSDYFLKFGSEVVIRLDAASGGLRARIVSIDGQAPQLSQSLAQTLNPDDVADQVLTTTRATGISASTAAITDNVDLSSREASLIKATLVTRSPATTQVLSNLPQASGITPSQLQSGTEFLVRITPQQTAGAPVAQQATVPTVPTATPGSPPVISTPAPATPAALPTNAAATLQTQAVPLNTPLPAATTPAAGAAVPNTIQSLLTPQPPIQGALFANTPSSETIPNPALRPVINTVNIPTSPTPAPSSPSSAGPPVFQSTVSTPTPASIPIPSTPPVEAKPQYEVYARQNPSPMQNLFSSVSSLFQSAAPTTPNTAANPGLMTATIMSTDRSGDVLLQTPAGVVKIPQGVLGNIPPTPGTQVNMEILGIKPNAMHAVSPAQLATPLAALPLANLAYNWATLQEIYQLVKAFDPQLAIQFAQRMPETGPRLSSSLMLFVSVLTGGDGRKWLGEPVAKALEQMGRGEMIARLSGEMGQMRQAFAEPPSNNWQMLYFPLMHGGDLEQVRMYLKREKQKEGDKKKKQDTRFIIELSLSAMGGMQFDGFVKFKDNKTQFDLMIRSLNPIPKEDEAAILGIYNNAAQLTGFIGNLAFQVVRDFPVKPMDEYAKGSLGGIVA